jgi:hypothetical protein
MSEGLSTSRHCHPFADCLAANGKNFVIRYHSRTTVRPQKRISPQEAAELARAGLDIATVYQDNGRLPSDFGLQRGMLDGQSAQLAAAAIGQPGGSAIYFAVDEDFDSQQIQSFVLDYFRGVKQGMDAAAGGTSAYDIGVYGSGLTCQLVRESFALAKYAWLAMATGWRGSAGYTTWDVRQGQPPGDLCGLGQQWERCVSARPFGAFRPVGYEVHAGEGEMRWVTAPQLNLRTAPSAASKPPITQLPEGHAVRVLGQVGGGWLRVRTNMGGGEVIGYVNGKYLSQQEGPASPTLAVGSVPAVHYRENDPLSKRGSTTRRAQPLGEPGQPTRDTAASSAQRKSELGQIVEWLDVESSKRYHPETVTFCNVYAADFCYLAGAYLPRTWWTASALMQIASGQTPPVVYDSTVRELRADHLYAWLAEFGPAFGWQRVFDVTALQQAANDGSVAVIVADRLEVGRPGHITIVVPETAAHQAQRDADGNVLFPVQSQAGAVNHNYSTIGKAWWNDQKFADEDGFFVHS